MDLAKFAVIFYLSLICISQPAALAERIQIQNQDSSDGTETLYDYGIDLDSSGLPKRLICPSKVRQNDLNDECKILQVFNQTQVDLMKAEYVKWLAETCACQLLMLYDKWVKEYDSDDQLTRQVAQLVRVRTNETLQMYQKYPVYFWTDIELVSYRVSVYTSMNDYFHKLKYDPKYRMSREMRQTMNRDKNWVRIGVVCKKISKDNQFLFRYLENLARLNPSAFFRLVLNDDVINLVYQASKACKMLLLLKLNQYKLRPDDDTIVVANRRLDSESVGYNSVEENEHNQSRDIETMIYQAKSLMPHNCHKISSNKTSPEEASKCPIIFDQGVTGDNVKIWLTNNANAPAARSMAAVQCGCQLLLYNSTWSPILRDPDVALMAKALTGYLNVNRVPDVASSPAWVIHEWFKETMHELTKSKSKSKGPIKEITEIVKTQRGGEEDSLDPYNSDKFAQARDILYRGCNVVLLSHDPATNRKRRFRLGQYLDELQLISSDPMYVFQLTLQDIDLFKIYALTKMCAPILVPK